MSVHDGCSGSFENGAQVVDKVRQLGFAQQPMAMPISIDCECGETFDMVTHEDKCPKCGMVYAVTPCHSFDPSNVMKAGINY